MLCVRLLMRESLIARPLHQALLVAWPDKLDANNNVRDSARVAAIPNSGPFWDLVNGDCPTLRHTATACKLNAHLYTVFDAILAILPRRAKCDRNAQPVYCRCFPQLAVLTPRVERILQAVVDTHVVDPFRTAHFEFYGPRLRLAFAFARCPDAGFPRDIRTFYDRMHAIWTSSVQMYVAK